MNMGKKEEIEKGEKKIFLSQLNLGFLTEQVLHQAKLKPDNVVLRTYSSWIARNGKGTIFSNLRERPNWNGKLIGGFLQQLQLMQESGLYLYEDALHLVGFLCCLLLVTVQGAILAMELEVPNDTGKG